MWTLHQEIIESKRIKLFSLFSQNKQLTYSQVIQLWQSDRNFCRFFSSTLAESDFPAYFWETPPITVDTVGQPFEFVLVNYPRLQEVSPNPNPFQRYFANADSSVVTFDNLGRDATLVAPCPLAEPSAYTQIANFSRTAPLSQQIALWQAVGKAIANKLDHSPLWISTSGLGVYWLHIRLDSVPKYYSYLPYKN